MDTIITLTLPVFIVSLIAVSIAYNRGYKDGREAEQNATAVRHERLRRRFAGSYDE